MKDTIIISLPLNGLYVYMVSGGTYYARSATGMVGGCASATEALLLGFKLEDQS